MRLQRCVAVHRADPEELLWVVKKVLKKCLWIPEIKKKNKKVSLDTRDEKK